MPSVMQDWTMELPYMQQGVLIAGMRGPDGLHKDHVVKLLLRWYRRCVIKSAFTGRDMWTPWEDGGGSFTGPSCKYDPAAIPTYFVPEHMAKFGGWNTGKMTAIVDRYLKSVDEVPHHFQLHLMNGAEILGYKHPDPDIRKWWRGTYVNIVNDMHLLPEPDERMDFRLGDRESNWRQCEAGIVAAPPENGEQ